MRRGSIIAWGMAGAIVAAGVAAIVALAPQTPDCVLSPEPSTFLDLQRLPDQRHLDADLAQVRRIAERYRDYVRTIPLRSQSIDARATLAARPERAYRYCVALLRENVAKVHHLAATDLPAQ